MKILITNYYFDGRTGSEIFTLELAKKLKNKGNEVVIFCANKGNIAVESEEAGIKAVSDIDYLKKLKFDIIHSHHNVLTYMVRSIFPDTPIIFYSQGFLPDLEQPPSTNVGIYKYIAISEEVANNFNKKGVSKKDITIIRNSVDSEVFKSSKKVNNKVKKVLILSNHFEGEYRETLIKTLKSLRISYSHVGLPNNVCKDVVDEINKADLVISLGRGVIEAMMCERNVIVYDIHGGDGFVDTKTYSEICKNNFSGRRFGIVFNKKTLINEINKYNPNLGPKLRKLAIQNHDLNRFTDEVFQIYKTSDMNSPVTPIPQREFKFLIKEAIGKFECSKYSRSLQDRIDADEKEIQNLNKSLEMLIQENNISKEKSLKIVNSRIWKLRNFLAKLLGKMEIK